MTIELGFVLRIRDYTADFLPSGFVGDRGRRRAADHRIHVAHLLDEALRERVDGWIGVDRRVAFERSAKAVDHDTIRIAAHLTRAVGRQGLQTERDVRSSGFELRSGAVFVEELEVVLVSGVVLGAHEQLAGLVLVGRRVAARVGDRIEISGSRVVAVVRDRAGRVAAVDPDLVGELAGVGRRGGVPGRAPLRVRDHRAADLARARDVPRTQAIGRPIRGKRERPVDLPIPIGLTQGMLHANARFEQHQIRPRRRVTRLRGERGDRPGVSGRRGEARRVVLVVRAREVLAGDRVERRDAGEQREAFVRRGVDRDRLRGLLRRSDDRLDQTPAPVDVIAIGLDGLRPALSRGLDGLEPAEREMVRVVGSMPGTSIDVARRGSYAGGREGIEVILDRDALHHPLLDRRGLRRGLLDDSLVVHRGVRDLRPRTATIVDREHQPRWRCHRRRNPRERGRVDQHGFRDAVAVEIDEVGVQLPDARLVGVVKCRRRTRRDLPQGAGDARYVGRVRGSRREELAAQVEEHIGGECTGVLDDVDAAIVVDIDRAIRRDRGSGHVDDLWCRNQNRGRLDAGGGIDLACVVRAPELERGAIVKRDVRRARRHTSVVEPVIGEPVAVQIEGAHSLTEVREVGRRDPVVVAGMVAGRKEVALGAHAAGAIAEPDVPGVGVSIRILLTVRDSIEPAIAIEVGDRVALGIDAAAGQRRVTLVRLERNRLVLHDRGRREHPASLVLEDEIRIQTLASRVGRSLQWTERHGRWHARRDRKAAHARVARQAAVDVGPVRRAEGACGTGVARPRAEAGAEILA